MILCVPYFFFKIHIKYPVDGMSHSSFRLRYFTRHQETKSSFFLDFIFKRKSSVCQGNSSTEGSWPIIREGLMTRTVCASPVKAVCDKWFWNSSISQKLLANCVRCTARATFFSSSGDFWKLVLILMRRTTIMGRKVFRLICSLKYHLAV